MELSAAGIALLTRDENFRGAAYQDQHGVWTIGWGTTRLESRAVRSGDTCTREQAAGWLQRDVRGAVAAVNVAITAKLTQNQFDALVSFTYNCGVGALRVSTLRKKLNAGDYAGAALEFVKWDHAGTKVSAGLLTRREQEQRLFNTSDAAESEAA